MEKELNFRDLGGYQSKDGRIIKYGVLFRSGSLSKASSLDIQELKQLNIHTVFDLRSVKEANVAKDPVISNKYLRANPAIDNLGQEIDFSGKGIQQRAKQIEGGLHHVLKVFDHFYESAPFNNQAIRLLLETLANNEVPLLFHCSAGKDRTGLMGIIIMLLLDIDESQIITEYLKTNLVYQDRIDKRMKQYWPLSKITLVKNIIYGTEGVLENYALIVLNSIKEKYHSYEEYFFQEYHLDIQQINQIKDKLLANIN